MGRKKLPATPPRAPAPPKDGAYQRFFDMGAEKLAAMDTMILRGDEMSAISRVLQGEWGFFPDVKNNTLQKQVQRYRDHFLIPRVQHLQAKVETGVIGQDKRTAPTAKAMFKRLDVMERWEEIVELQRARILKVYKREQGMPDGVVLDSLTKLFKDYNHSLAQVTDLQLETGYLKRAPKVLQGQFGFGGETEDGRPIFEFAIQEQQEHRAALADMSELLQEVLEGECTRVEPRRSKLPDPAAGGAEPE